MSKDIDSKKRDFEAKGGKIADQSRELLSERGNLSGRLEQIQSDLVDMAATELPLALVKSLLTKIVVQVKKENEKRSMQAAINKISNMLPRTLKPTINGELYEDRNLLFQRNGKHFCSRKKTCG